MEQPHYILEGGTRIRTHKKLDSAKGMNVASQHLAARVEDTVGRIGNVVGGHGGDVYFVVHEDGTQAAYCYTEFELITEVPIEKKTYEAPTLEKTGAFQNFQYATTEGELTLIDVEHGTVMDLSPTPAPPDNRGDWELTSSICHKDRVLWFWSRRNNPYVRPM